MSKWWQDRVFYQIYPRSFMDSNGDGIGDIPGIISRLPEIKKLGVGAIWLCPVYASPNADNGYDISDYRAINPEYGTMDDMDELIAKAGELDLKIVMDLVVNHTSCEHEWFKKSCEGDERYRDYYIWRDKPNNWTSFFAESCWEYCESRGQYYLHLFAKGQPDLNFKNPAVVDEVKDIMRFWLDKGVAGFRCDVINVIDKQSLDDGRRTPFLRGLEHYNTTEGCHRILQELRRDVLSKYDAFAVGEAVFVDPGKGRLLCGEDRGELDTVFGFQHMEADQIGVKWLKKRFSLKKFARAIESWQTSPVWNANYLENHDQPRSVSRFGDDGEYREQSAKMLCTLLLSLRGTPFIYQGEELGMTNTDCRRIEELDDVESKNVDALLKRYRIPEGLRRRIIMRTSRDNARTPMQWTDGAGGGFTTGRPWLRVNDNTRRINYKSEDRDQLSVLNYYRRMIELRSLSDTLMYGSFRLLRAGGGVMMFERSFAGVRAVVLLNFTPHTRRARCEGLVAIATSDRETYDGTLLPYEGMIVIKRPA